MKEDWFVLYTMSQKNATQIERRPAMIIQMKPGLGLDHESVKAVSEKALQWKVIPEPEMIQGTEYNIISIRLYDGENKSNIIPEHVFEVMDGVVEVTRITPPEISLAHADANDAKVIDLTSEIKISHNLPTRLVIGPCTVDKNIDAIVENLAGLGVKMIRGGCWKPRSSPYSFPGHGEKAVHWLLEAAKKHNMECVWLEVMESSHIDIVKNACKTIGYTGRVVLWVGARTKSSILLRSLGAQKDFPVMLKHSLSDDGPEKFIADTQWVVNGPVKFDDDGQMIEKESNNAGNHDLMLCLRGTNGAVNPWRFRPNWDWTEYIKKNWWTPVVIDPSHAAGTVKDGLVLTSVKTALIHKPSVLLVEGGYSEKNEYRGLCDADQSLVIEKIPELIGMIKAHNKKHYGLEVF